ncbi:MAG: phenylphosphate carboxylase subunit gamma [Chloroflexi bacterium]|nr:phenylphosphate carboxylase subunit gamma [Chloroflexota bacterium]
MKEYMTFIEDPDKIKGPTELSLTIRDLEPGPRKYTGHNVIATVSPSPMPGADLLRVRHTNGLLLPQPWYIKVTKDIGDYLHERPYAGIVD